MKTAKQKRLSEQRFPITFPSIPIQTLRAAAKTYLAFRRVDYHFGRDYKSIFFRIQRARDAITARQVAHRSLPITFSATSLRYAVLRRKLVDAAVIGRAAVNRRAVEIAESIDDHAVVGEATIWRARERMNDTLSPLSATDGS